MGPEIAPRHLHPLSPLASVGIAMLRIWPVVLLAIARASWQMMILLLVSVITWRVAVWWRTTWSLGADGLVVRSGIWRREIQTVPPQRVQQIEIRAGLRHRVLGLGVVRIGLAGGGEQSQVELDALRRSEAGELQGVLEAWRRRGATTWPAPTGPAVSTMAPPPTLPDAATPVIFRVRFAHLVAAGLSSRTLWLAPVAAFFGALQLLGEIGLGEEARETLRDWLTSTGPLIVGPLVIGGAVALAITLSLVRHHDFQVLRRGQEFTLRRGLLEQRSVRVPQNRIQTVRITGNLLRTALGLGALEIQTADLGTRTTTAVDVPIGRVADLEDLSATLLGHRHVDIHLGPHPAAAVRREVLRRVRLLAPLTVGLMLAVIGPARVTALMLLGAFGLAVALAALTGVPAGRRRATGWDDHLILVRTGFMQRSTWAVPIDRVQSIGTVQNPFQRRAGLISVRIDVAGTRTGVLIRDLGVGRAAALLTHLGPVLRPQESSARAQSATIAVATSAG